MTYRNASLVGILILGICIGIMGCASTSKIKIPKFKKIKLDNGITVYLMKDPTLPSFAIQGMISYGAANESSNRSGQARIMMEMLKEGSGTLGSKDYKQAYSKYSSDFEYDIDKNFLHFQSIGLSKYSSPIMTLFLKTLFRPHFIDKKYKSESQKSFSKLKKKNLHQISQSYESAAFLADQALASQLFVRHPYGTPISGTMSHVKKLQLRDAREFYSRVVHPTNLQFALTGDFGSSEVKLLIDSLKGIKSQTPLKIKPVPIVVSERSKPKIVVVHKANLKQVQVRIGQFGPPRESRDFIDLYIANGIVGGGEFTSRFMAQLRTERGLVYHSYAYFMPYKRVGSFTFSGSTRYPAVTELVTLVLKIMNSAKSSGVTLEELKLRKSFLIGQFPRKFETPESYVYQLMRNAVYGFRSSYLRDFYNKIDHLSLSQASRVLAKYYKPEEALIVVLGDKKKLVEPLKALNLPMEVIPYRKVLE